MRIVSLLPAATEIVCALGLRRSLVARSHECDFPAGVEALPALTRARVDSASSSAAIDEDVRKVVASGLPIYTLDEETLAALAPDVVVTQEACAVCAISYDQVLAAVLGASAGARVIALSPTRLDHIVADVQRVADACGVSARGEAVTSDLGRRLARTAGRTEAKPRIAVIEWLAPVMLAGHWVPDAIEAAGGVAVGPAPGDPSPYRTWDEVRGLRPDAVIVAPCGFDLERTRRESAAFGETLRTLAPRVLLLDGNAYLNRPGPRIVEAVETIAAWLRGEPVPENRGAVLGAALLTSEPPSGRDSRAQNRGRNRLFH